MSFILLVLVSGIFYWLFLASGKGSFSSAQKPLDFETVLYSEFGYIIALIAKLAKSDGHISDLEVELIESILDDLCSEFHDPIQARTHLKLIFNEEKDIQENVKHVASSLYDKTRHDNYKHQKIVEFLVTLAFVDGHLHPKEKGVILEISRALHINQGTTESLFAQFYDFYEERTHHQPEHINVNTYYQLLNIDETYDKITLKSAYKKGVKEHHPDVIMGKGGSEEDIKNATSKLQEINEAYEYLKKLKNF